MTAGLFAAARSRVRCPFKYPDGGAIVATIYLKDFVSGAFQGILTRHRFRSFRLRRSLAENWALRGHGTFSSRSANLFEKRETFDRFKSLNVKSNRDKL